MRGFYKGHNKQYYVKKCLINSFKNKDTVPDSLYDKYSLKAPKNFSIIGNPHETIDYFNTIIDFVGRAKNFVLIRYDLSEINNITIDAIIYMIAISLNINSLYNPKFRVLIPDNPSLRELVLSSGIANFFNAGEIEISKNNDYFTIKMGNKTDVELAQSICDFTNESLKLDFRDTKFLYDMLIEMMTNTGQHAYNKTDKIQTQWFIFAECNENKIKYTFIDTGLGIPQTMSKHILSINQKDLEKDGFILDILNQFSDEESNDTLLLLTGLRGGGFRTRTNKPYRGKGLPEIYDHYKELHKTSNLKIISGACLCEFDEKNRETPIVTELRKKFLGTLFYWEINKDDLKKGNVKNEI